MLLLMICQSSTPRRSLDRRRDTITGRTSPFAMTARNAISPFRHGSPWRIRPLKLPKEKVSSSSVKDKTIEPARGKTRFYRESIRLNQDMVEGQLMGFSHLIIALKIGHYGEMRFYMGSSSSGEPDSLKEESYHLAHSLGVPLDANMACEFNLCEIGLHPTGSTVAAKFSKCYSRFHAHEVERGLLNVEDAKLAEANDYHLISVNRFLGGSFRFCFSPN